MTENAASRALQLDGVGKSFRRETGETVLALDNISFSIGKGGLAALAGVAGATGPFTTYHLGFVFGPRIN